MKLCTFCPKGTKCTGNVLFTLIAKLYDAMSVAGNSDELIKFLSRDEILTLANKGAEAHEECWSKAFVLSIAGKFVVLADQDIPDDQLRQESEAMINLMKKLFSRLPTGGSIDLSALVPEIYNQTCEIVNQQETEKMFPINIISQACMKVVQNKNI